MKTVSLAAVVEDVSASVAAIDYAVALCEHESAHLSSRIAAPDVDFPTGTILPLVQVVAEQLNAERLAKATTVREKIETAARIAGVPVDCQLMQRPYLQMRDAIVSATRASDLVILPQPAGLLSWEKGLVESVLFGSGRPSIVVPPGWTNGPVFERILVAWDGGARAARAVGDAMALMERAAEVEVVSIVADIETDATGAEVSEHLARHCRRLKLTDLPIAHSNTAERLRDHVEIVRPDLVVMGAYAHSRVLQFVLGGVTSLMLSSAGAPVLYSY